MISAQLSLLYQPTRTVTVITGHSVYVNLKKKTVSCFSLFETLFLRCFKNFIL